MSLLNKLFKKEIKKEAAASKIESKAKKIGFKRGDILLSPLATEKAVSGQSLNKYIFKVAPKANKIDIIKAISKIYNVKAVSANVINIPQKARQVGRTKGFKSGYKKAVVTLAKGQSIEVK